MIIVLCSKNNSCLPSSVPYVVREGDTLYNIALSYGTDVESITNANVNLNPYNLNVGQKICVPLPKEEYPKCRTTNYYIAQEGDTFYSIAKKFNVDVSDLTETNIGIAPENIFDGIILCIPVAPSPVCLNISRDGALITLIDKNGEEKSFASHLHDNISLVPQSYILTKKRLESGSREGAKELLFSPGDIGIRGESKMQNSSASFIVTDDDSMLTLFNALPVGCQMEVTK
jgi:LysM repeat protein